MEVLDTKMAAYKNDLQAAVEAHNKKIEDETKNINEDLAKKGATLAEIQDTLKEVQAKQGRIAAITEEAKNDFTSMVVKGISENFDNIKGVKKGNNLSFEVKTVGDILLSANLTGSGVARYSLDPAVRGRRKAHYRDLVQVIPTDTGTWKYYRQDTPVGEGSFGVQTEGSACLLYTSPSPRDS